MCRPLHASWVGESVALSVQGEGSHEEVAEDLNLFGGDSLAYDSGLGQFIRTRTMEKETQQLYPFETRWTTERVALWQPNTARFYRLEDMPTKRQFDLAQERFDLDMGTWELARDWILAAAELYGKSEASGHVPSSPAYVGASQTLWAAAQSVLMTPTMSGLQTRAVRVISQSPSTMIYNLQDVGTGQYYVMSWEQATQIFGPGRPMPTSAFPYDVPRLSRFDEWAERFSERKNRIELWAN